MGSTAIGEDPQAAIKTFTLPEARALLPLVRALIAGFNEARDSASAAAKRLDEIERARSKENVLAIARPLRETRSELGERTQQMRDVVRQMQDLGVEVKHLDPALIDFPCLFDGHVVYLCWQEGEETVAFWHETDAGFAGRQRLP
jgi:hypothetical protein